MSDCTAIPFVPWTRSASADAAFLAEIEAINADCRARRVKLAADRASFWERATCDVQADYSRQYDGVNFFEGGE